METNKIKQVFENKIKHINEHIDFILDELNVEDKISNLCLFIQKNTEDLFINKHFVKELNDLYDDINYMQETKTDININEWLKSKNEYYIHKILNAQIIPATTNLLYNFDKQCEVIAYQNIVKFINLFIKK